MAAYMPDINIDIGTRHLKDLDRQVRQHYPRVQGLDRVNLIAAAYNAGWGRIVRAGGHVPPIWETRGYVRRG
ncbi:MAG TPA: lytic transglycosylase domain-containing protein, partial [Candidatus Latescibacteria bacterium]|nr:lytic transglycosylase domain-containing protein [Candidatus Latescibacterota bacterium]